MQKAAEIRRMTEVPYLSCMCDRIQRYQIYRARSHNPMTEELRLVSSVYNTRKNGLGADGDDFADG